MSLLTLIDAELAYGDAPLLDGASLSVETRDRIGLIGRNGTGKSSLLSVVAGERALDDGELRVADGTRIVRVEQEPLLPDAPTLRDSLLQRLADTLGQGLDDWTRGARLDAAADRFGIDLSRPLAGLSGGERKRAALAAALAAEPDLLLLDEPTNHLDIDAIEHLEALLARGPTLIVITHDRRFLDAVCTRIVELDRGQLRSYAGNYATYERLKQEQLADEAVRASRFDKFWKQEEAWIRQGVQARRTRDEGRVRRLERLRVERAQRRERLGSVKVAVDAGERSGKLVAELEHVCKRFARADGGERRLIDDFSALIQRGDRIGLVGPNGAGKTTLLRIILGQEPADAGRVRLGHGLRVAYFDQMRAQLDPRRTVAETISPGSEWIETAAGRKHVMSYLSDFLFSPRRANSPVQSLSGGERNRLLLARLFAQPANLLVLDEPTNDLDIDSLEMLETALLDYPGTLLLVSHDRAFLDAVVTQVIGYEGDGRWRMIIGGHGEWRDHMARLSEQRAAQTPPRTDAAAAPAPRARQKDAARPKLGFNEKRELDAMPETIARLETEQRELHDRMAGADYFRTAPEQQRQDQERADTIELELMEKLERWEALEAIASAGQERPAND
ncbi:MAG: ATP-binding cassette domain-containing protein [Burkholderiaceae bacterium]